MYEKLKFSKKFCIDRVQALSKPVYSSRAVQYHIEWKEKCKIQESFISC